MQSASNIYGASTSTVESRNRRDAGRRVSRVEGGRRNFGGLPKEPSGWRDEPSRRLAPTMCPRTINFNSKFKQVFVYASQFCCVSSCFEEVVFKIFTVIIATSCSSIIVNKYIFKKRNRRYGTIIEHVFEQNCF